jgi:pimeloyl-ACP methyl ester carboxylesterase
VVTKDEIIKQIWNGRIVSEDTLSSRIRAARKAIGDDGKAQSLIRTVQRRGFRFVGGVSIEHGERDAGSAPVAGKDDLSVSAPAPAAAELKQEIKYCRTPDGVRLAYARTGDGPPLVKAGNWMNHLEYDWESPVWGHVFRGLAKKYSLIRYDARGNGLSDWDVAELSFDAWLRDLETVVDAVGVDRFPLLGISQGCAISVAYAVRHPKRVSHLILYGGFALGAKKRTPEGKQQRDAIITLVRLGWGQNNPAFRRMFSEMMVPGATDKQMTFFNELQRRTTTPEIAARYFDITGDFDVTHLVGKVTAPTLVMHTREEAAVPIEAGRELAASIPNAKFVTLPGQNHLFLEHEPAARRFFEEVEVFLGC